MRISKFMAGAALATAVVAATALVSFAPAAHASTYTFNFVDAADSVTANGTIDVVGGYAISGTGTVNTPQTGAGASLTLMTLTSPGAAGNVTDIGSGVFSYRWGGTDLIVDNVVPLNGNGLLFGVGPSGTFSGTSTGYEFGVAIWLNGGDSYALYWANSAGGSGGYNGTFTYALAEVGPATTPLPAALPLFASGLGALGLLGWRRKRKAAAIVA